MKKPNFFIIGAPKCGTTSLASWLAEHPEVYMSPIKEPHVFHPGEPHVVNSLEDYEKLFKAAAVHHKIIGEASTNYLFSKEAVPSILNYSKNPRFLVALRNPIEMVCSLHDHRVYMQREDVLDFEVAWNLQSKRMKGEGLPPGCKSPELLQYGPYCRLGEQIEMLLQRVAPGQCKFVLLEDIKSDPRKVWLEIMEFLEIEDDGKREFDAKNKAKTVRSRFFQKAIRKLGQMKKRMGFDTKTGLLTPLSNWNKIERHRPPLSKSMRSELRTYFKEDILKLESILERDLSHWK